MQTSIDMNETIRKAKNGDEDSFKAIYDAYWCYVLFIVSKLCRNEADARDVLQDVFFQVFKDIKKLEDDTKFKPWLRQLTLRACYKRFKKHQRFITEEDAIPEDVVELDDDFLPEEYLQKKELRQSLLKIINSLPTRQREAIYLYYYMGMTTNEIANYQKCSPESVRKAMYDARKSIKNKLEKDKKRYEGVLVPLFPLFTAEAKAHAAKMTGAAGALVFLIVLRRMRMTRVAIYAGGIIATVLLISAAITGAVYQNTLGHNMSDIYENVSQISNTDDTDYADETKLSEAEVSFSDLPPVQGGPLPQPNEASIYNGLPNMQLPPPPQGMAAGWDFLGWTTDEVGLDAAQAANMTWAQALEAGYVTIPPLTMGVSDLDVIAVWGDRYGVIGRMNQDE